MLTVIEVPIADLIPYVNNARTHSDEQVAQIAASIKEFGWTNPILIDGENGIIAGHGRLAAARKLKMDAVPAIQLDGLSEAQKKALILADNKLALNSGWDYDLLKIELDALSDIGFDLAKIGFDENELTTIMFGEELEEKTPKEQSMKSVYEIAVECKDENEQQAVFDMLTEKGYKCRVLTM
jgi:ParB-like chromosome segregation protein Spo0J